MKDGDTVASVGGGDATVPVPSRPQGPASPDRAAPRSGAECRSTDDVQLQTVDPGAYDLGTELARGGMGRILHARDRRHGRAVAIKEALGGDTRRFEHEALITARLQHPAIVPVYEAGRWPDGSPFYAMKMVSGQPLDRAIAGAPTLLARMALLPNVIAACEALAYAHDLGVIHRDLKPSNVLVGNFGETVVIDWGLAKQLRERDAPATPNTPSGADMTVAGDVLGTPQYMPPEQASGDSVDERADVYALGAMLYHLLAGVPPYDAAPVHALIAQVVDGPPPPLDRRIAGVPADLLAIVGKAMARATTARYRDARDLAEDLRRFQTGQLVRAHSYSAGERVRRFVAKYRAATTIAVLSMLVFAAGSTVAVWQLVDKKDAAERAEGVATKESEDADDLAQLTLASAARQLDFAGHTELVEDTAQLIVNHFEALDGRGRMTDRRRVQYATALRRLATAQLAHLRADQADATLDRAETVLAGVDAIDATRELAAVKMERTDVDPHVGRSAEQHARDAGTLAARVLATVPDDPPAVRVRSKSLAFDGWYARHAGRTTDARAAYEQALAMLEPLDDREAIRERIAFTAELATAVSEDDDRASEARGIAEQGLALASRLDAADRAGQRVVADARYALAEIENEDGPPARARADFEAALAGYSRLLETDPANASLESDVADVLLKLAEMALASHELADTARYLDRSTAYVEALAMAEPRDHPRQLRVSRLLHLKAELATDQSRLDLALAAYVDAAVAVRRIPEADRTPGDRNVLHYALAGQGDTLLALHRPADALVPFEEDLAQTRVLVDANSAVPDWLQDLAEAEEHLALAHAPPDREMLASAVAHWQKLVARRPKYDEGIEGLARAKHELEIIPASGH